MLFALLYIFSYTAVNKGVDYVEQMLRNQIVAAIGKEVRRKEFSVSAASD
jgi:hypothetical protein